MAETKSNHKIEVACVCCGNPLEISIAPVRVSSGFVSGIVYPCEAAPHICPACRPNPKKLASAREEMERHFRECRKGHL